MTGILTTKPVATFYYKDNQTHPVRRTVLLVKDTPSMLIGYEIRVGKKTVDPSKKRVLRSYLKSRIPTWGSYSRFRMSSKNMFRDPNESTLERKSLTAFFSGKV